MSEINFDTVRAVWQVVQEKLEYKKSLESYVRPQGIRGIFSRPPKDPWQDLTLSDCSSLLSDAVEAAFPSLNGNFPGPEGPDVKHCSFYVDVNSEGNVRGVYRERNGLYGWTHQEDYELKKKGYGLQFVYSHNDDPSKDAANRNLAYKHYMGDRLVDDFFEQKHAEVDDACWQFVKFFHQTSYSKSELKAEIEKVREFHRERNRKREDYDRLLVVAKNGVSIPASFRDYVNLLTERATRDAEAWRNPKAATPVFLARYSAIRDAIAYSDGHVSLDDVRPIGFSGDLIASCIKHEFPLQTHLDYAHDSYGSSKEIEVIYEKFTQSARLDGYSSDDILKAVQKDLGVESLSGSLSEHLYRNFYNVDYNQQQLVNELVRERVMSNQEVSMSEISSALCERREIWPEHKKVCDAARASNAEGAKQAEAAESVKHPAFLPAGTVYEVSREDLEEGKVPPGTDIGVTAKGDKYLKLFGENRQVPEEGLVLVKKDDCTNLYICCTKEQFKQLYSYDEKTGITSKKNLVRKEQQPGLRNNKNKTNQVK